MVPRSIASSPRGSSRPADPSRIDPSRLVPTSHQIAFIREMQLSFERMCSRLRLRIAHFVFANRFFYGMGKNSTIIIIEIFRFSNLSV